MTMAARPEVLLCLGVLLLESGKLRAADEMAARTAQWLS
jgi:hypothetical protein